MTVDFSRPFAGQPQVVERPDGTRIHTVVAGSGEPTVVLAHGYGADADCWNEMGDRLSDARVIAFDQRGHGRSTIGSDGVGSSQMVGDYVAVLEAHDVRDAVLVGHSMGGFLAIRFFLDHPEVARERIRACLLMATFAGDVNRSNAQNRVQIPLIRSGILVSALRFSLIAKAFVRSIAGRPFDAGIVEPFIRSFRSHDHSALIPILQALVDESNYDRLGEIDLPCTIVVGELDHTTPPFHTDELHAGITGSKVVRLPGKGHLLNWEAPDDLVREIRALLEGG